ncbi:MAG: hypothetical protein ACOYNI_11535 [Acidimicrobiia bacterium]
MGRALRRVGTRAGSVALVATSLVAYYAAPALAAAPASITVPVLSTPAHVPPQVGVTITSSPGEWDVTPDSFSYEFLRCDEEGDNCTTIVNSSSATYALIVDDIGHTIKVTVTASNGDGNDTASSLPTAVVLPLAPVNTVLPAISGTTKQDETLSVDTGTWSNTPDEYAYEWLRCNADGNNCVDIIGAEASTYELGLDDVAHTVRVRVTATNDGGFAQVTTEASAEIVPLDPVNTAAPTISGTAQDGHTLSASPGTWSNTPSSYSYQWQRCDSSGANCADITDETAQTYDVVSEDVGGTIVVVVTATNAAASVLQASDPTDVVLIGVPDWTDRPVLSGTEQEGETLSATDGTWTNSPTGYTYQWQRCNSSGAGCTDITGETNNTYLLAPADVGQTVRITVTATNDGGSDSAYSLASGVIIIAAPTNTVLPAISGTAQDGNRLVPSTGTWTHAPTAYTYQWQRCDNTGSNCADITGETFAFYDLIEDDIASTIVVVVTATNAGGSNSATSAATAVVLPKTPLNTVIPVVTGTARVGETLSTDDGTWTANPTFAYQWVRCNAAGAVCTNIASATNNTYTLAAADLNARIRAVITATNAAAAVSASSSLTVLVLPALPANTALPTITGTAQRAKTLTASTGTWQNAPRSFAYRWQRCDSSGASCANIANGAAKTYVPAANDVTFTLRVVVTATNTAGSASATSAATAVVTPSAPAASAVPVVTGASTQGVSLSTSDGTWTNSPSSYAYQWLRCNTAGTACSAIGSATTSSYTLAAADVGATVRVSVTATGSGGTGTATSNATTVVKATAPTNSVTPSISGTARATRTLTGANGTWAGTGNAYKVRWERCNPAGSSCTTILGQTGNSYAVAARDVGFTIRYTVTATNTGGTLTVSSSVTSVVVAA